MYSIVLHELAESIINSGEHNADVFCRLRDTLGLDHNDPSTDIVLVSMGLEYLKAHLDMDAIDDDQVSEFKYELKRFLVSGVTGPVGCEPIKNIELL